jgi:hypothetical protein
LNRCTVKSLNRKTAHDEALAVSHLLGKNIGMTREQVESAVASGAPFTLRMADGKEYLVPHRDYISLPPKASYVIVYDDDGHFTVLPLLTMTGLRSKLSPEKQKK